MLNIPFYLTYYINSYRITPRARPSCIQVHGLGSGKKPMSTLFTYILQAEVKTKNNTFHFSDLSLSKQILIRIF